MAWYLEEELARVNRKLKAVQEECNRLKRGVIILNQKDNGYLSLYRDSDISGENIAAERAIIRAERLQQLYFNMRQENMRLKKELNYRRDQAVLNAGTKREIEQLKMSIQVLIGHCKYLDTKNHGIYNSI